eukprot:1091704-Rhodomonas_salina.1
MCPGAGSEVIKRRSKASTYPEGWGNVRNSPNVTRRGGGMCGTALMWYRSAPSEPGGTQGLRDFRPVDGVSPWS